MRNPIQLILDVYSGLSHRSQLETGPATMAPFWVGEDNLRRLRAYKLLESYYRNRSREFTSVGLEAGRREYGDASLLVNVVRSALTGDDISLVVDGDDDAATARQDDLDAWATDEHLPAKIVETERDAIKLGDGVYVLGTSQKKGRVRVRLFDPGFYFPVIDPNASEDEFPRRVHVAWEFTERNVDGESVTKIRRITWALGPITPGADDNGAPLPLADGDTVGPMGAITRTYPWDDQPSTETVYLSDGIWTQDNLDDIADVDSFGPPDVFLTNDEGAALDRFDIRQDFIPVVHIPNTVAIKEHFGEALLTSVAQVLDEIQASDTDASKAAALASVPVVGISGTQPKDLTISPGAVFGLGTGGSMDALDLSGSLQAVMGYVEAQRRLLSVNARVSDEVLGRVKAADIKSGIQLALSFGPMRSLIAEMRLVRAEKYPILVKFVQRMSIAAGFWQGEVLDARIEFGSFLPTDAPSAIEAVTKLFGAHLISRSTAISQLLSEGIIDVDLADELKTAQTEDFAAAVLLLDATEGDLDAVYKFLGRTKPKPAPANPALAPVAPGQPPAPGAPPVPGAPFQPGAPGATNGAGAPPTVTLP